MELTAQEKQERKNREEIMELKAKIELLNNQILDEKINLIAELKKQKMFFGMLRNDAFTHRQKHNVCDLATSIIDANIIDAKRELKHTLEYNSSDLPF